MKRICFSILLLFFLFDNTGFGQNLIPNPSFEEYTDCPHDQYGVDLATPWTAYRQTPDFFNACDITNGAGVPYSTIYGYQYPFHGVGQFGLIAVGFPMDREIIGVELISPLEMGQDYYISFYANRGFGGGAHSNCDCAVNNLGVKFCNQAYSVTNPIPIDNHPDFFEPTVITDTLNWTHVSGWFTADSAYSHFALGNFFDEDHNTVENYNGYPYYNTYYFIDAVCVTKYPDDCDALVSGVNNPKVRNDNLRIYPNPVINQLNIKVEGSCINHLTILDFTGRIISKVRVSECNTCSFDTGQLSEGLYIVKVALQDGLNMTKTFLKTK